MQPCPGSADGSTMRLDVNRIEGLKKFAALLVFLTLPGCSSGVITHDGYRAAELVVDFLSSLENEQGLRAAYAWTDDGYKAEVPFAEFARIISTLRTENSGAEIRLAGYETFGSKELIVIHAESEIGDCSFR